MQSQSCLYECRVLSALTRRLQDCIGPQAFCERDNFGAQQGKLCKERHGWGR